MTRHQAVLRALGGKLSLGALVAAAGGAALMESWSVLLTGMGVLMLLLLRELRAARGKPRTARIPEGSSFKNGAVREAIEAIGAAQRERLDALDNCPDDVLAMLDGILRTAAEVEVVALRIARRADRLHGYLVRKDLGFVRRSAHMAMMAAEKAKSACEQQDYEAAARVHEVEAVTIEGIEVGMRATLAKLENIRATLAALPSRIVRLQATHAEVGDGSFLRLSEDLRGANDELEEVEQHMQALSQGSDEQVERESARVAVATTAMDIRIAVGALPSREAAELEEPAGGELRGVKRMMF